jgi:Leucine-rich repeat (LRR) protein
MKAKITFLLLLFSLITQAQIGIYFSDSNFKSKLIDLGIDTNGDGQIQISEAHAVTGTLDISDSNISSLLGIGFFTNMTVLQAEHNQISSVDLTNNTALTEIHLNYNELTSIEIADLPNLSIIEIAVNQLTYLDLSNISPISSLNVSTNLIEDINLTNVFRIDWFDCSVNKLTSLDLSNMVYINRLYCSQNNLVNLNLKNGYNMSSLEWLYCTNNPLECIEVNDATNFSETHFAPHDGDVGLREIIPVDCIYNENCSEQVYIENTSFETKLIHLGIDSEAVGFETDHRVLRSDVLDAGSYIDMSSSSVTGITDIKKFTNTTAWNFSNLYLLDVDVTMAPWVTQYNFSNTNIETINLDGMSSLEYINLNNNSLTNIDLSDCTALETLYLNNNNLSEIDITQNTALIDLNLSNNLLTLVNPFYNDVLENVDVSDNNLQSSFILFNHPNLQTVYCDNNQLNVLSIYNSPNLLSLSCSNNNLSGVNVSSSINLQTIDCNHNQLEEIDLGENTVLSRIIANDNLFSGNIEVNHLNNLYEFNMANNIGIEKINIKNGHNTDITLFNATGCTALTTVCVDDETVAPTASGWSVDDVSVYTTCAIAIPDANFEQALIDLGIDTYHDNVFSPSPNGYINTIDVEGITYLPIFNKNINDLTGINYFVDLEALIANNNNLTGIDVSALSNLRTLNLKNNQLDAFNMTLPNPSDLRNLYLDDNQDFSSGRNIDDVIYNQSLLEKLTLANNNATFIELTNFPNLEQFNCSNNPSIDDLDVGNSPNLKELKAAYCNLSNLNLTSIHSLDLINVEHNNITSLFLGSQPHLDSFRCNNNSISTLDVGAAPMLGFFKCSNNNLVSLDVSNNHNIGGLTVSNNPLSSLNIKNNNNFIMFVMEADNLAAACCIQVDDQTNTPPADTGTYTYDWIIDATAIISEDCTPTLTYVPDDNFEQALIDLGYDTTLDDFVTTSNINSITNLDISNNNIHNLTGIEDFVALEIFNCSDNVISTIDLSFNTNLQSLICSDNQVSSINVENCLSLIYLEANTNEISELNLENNIALEVLYLGQNWLTSLNLVANNNLRKLAVDYNFLTELNLQNANNTNISLYNSNFNPDLLCINVDDASWSTTNWTNVDSASSFSETCGLTYVPDDNFENYLETHNASGGLVPPGNSDSLGNGITNDNYIETARVESLLGIDLTAKNIADLTGINSFEALTALVIAENNLTSLDLSNLVNLQALDAHGNFSLASVTVANNNVLEYVNFENDNLSGSLYNIIDNSPNLIGINAKNNQLSGDIELFDIPNLEEIYLGNNNIESIDISETPLLRVYSVSNNNLEYIDLSSLDKLTTVLVSNCNLTYLNVKTGTNMSTLTAFDTRSNPNLTCITVDDIAYSETNWPHKDATASYNTDCNPALTYVPDNNFEQALVDLGYDDVLDDYVLTSNISSLLSLDVSNKNIANLTGIEDFTSLDGLKAHHNTLTNVDLTNNTNLIHIELNDNLLTDITIGNDVFGLILDNNNLSNLNIGNYSIVALSINNNNFNNLDLSNNDVLYLLCDDNNLSNITLSSNNTLVYLSCERNLLSSLNLENNDITHLLCKDNLLISLDLSSFTNLEYLDCSNNNLQELNIQNGNNEALSGENFFATGNPNLTCILVDDATWSTSNLHYIDATSTFVNSMAECDALAIADDYLYEINIYPNPVNDVLTISINNTNPSKIVLFDTLGRQIKEVDNTDKISFDGLNSGVYFVKIHDKKNNIAIKKIIRK